MGSKRDVAWPPAFAHAGSKLKRSALSAGDERRNSGARAEIVEKRTMTPAGLEPAIPGSVGRCLIHWATGPDGSRQLFAVRRPGYMHGDRHSNPQTNTKEQHGVLSERREILRGRRERYAYMRCAEK